VKRMSRMKLVNELSQVHDEKSFSCDACSAAKQTRVPHPASNSRADYPCQLLHTDLMCPTDEGLHIPGTSYVLTVLDDYSRYAEVAVLASKEQASRAFEAIANRLCTQSGKSIKAVRFGRGSEFFHLGDWMTSKGIIPQAVAAGTPEANGRAERLNRTLKERVRALLQQFELPTSLWQFAIEVVAYTRNMVPSVEMDTTPFELFFGIRRPGRFLWTQMRGSSSGSHKM